MPAVAEPHKRLGPGALIFVAKQLGPKSACTGSFSSEASIKATLFQDRTDNTHMKVSPEITTQIISYISEFAAERKFITNHVQSSKVLQKSKLHKLFMSDYCSGRSKRLLAKRVTHR